MSQPTQAMSDTSADTTTAQIALVGNPNTGKTTMFTALTGVRQRVGNYPGVTVEKTAGAMSLGNQEVTLIDLPGTYSLAAASRDERVVLDVLAGHIEGTRKPELVICVVDACNITRNLFLASQVADLDIPMVIALNMTDRAVKQGIEIDAAAMSQRMGIPVIATVASTGEGLDELRTAATMALREQPKMKTTNWPEPVEQSLTLMRESVQQLTQQNLSDAELLRLLFDQKSAVAERIGLAGDGIAQVTAEPRKILDNADLRLASAESVIRYGELSEMLEGVVAYPDKRQIAKSESIDRIFTHPVAGMVVFVGLMFVVFWSIYRLASPLMDAVDWAFGSIGDWVAPMLEGSPMLQSLIVDGVIGGVGGMIIFLPQILILFFFISLLEDSGYMARAAILVDRLFRWCGLNGRSFVPMLSSFACAIPGVMSARTIENPKARLTTILIAPLMSCSARLPVYVIMISAFVAPLYGDDVAAIVLFGMHFVGLAVALPVAFVINRLILKAKPQPFIMEVPNYRVPRLVDVLGRMWENGREFLLKAGTVIFAMSIVIWALLYFPRPAEVADTAKAAYDASVAEKWQFSLERVQTLQEDEEARAALADQQAAAAISKFLDVSVDQTQALLNAIDVALAGIEGADEMTPQQVAAELIQDEKLVSLLPPTPGMKNEPTASDESEWQIAHLSHVYGLRLDANDTVASVFETGADNAIEAAYIEQSVMGRMGQAVQPVFDPAGFDWKITVGVLGSFPAREVIIATMGIIYSLGGDVDEESDSLKDAMAASTWTSGPRAGQPVFTVPVAFAIMVFFALCSQCGATVATIAKETNWKWAIFSFVYMTVLAWIGAVVVYQVGTAIMS